MSSKGGPLVNFINSLLFFSCSVVNTGCLTPLFKLCECGNPFISLVAMTTLCLIAECSNNHRAILEEKNSLRKLLTKVSDSKDEKVR